MEAGFSEELSRWGAHLLPHSGRTLQEHLLGTCNLLKAWGCPPHVCKAGMFHSIYGTNAFQRSCLTEGDRAMLHDSIGVEAERLVYLFSVSDRPVAFLKAVPTLTIISRLTGQVIEVTKGELQELMAIECANLMEQGAVSGLIEVLLRLPEEQRSALVGTHVSDAMIASTTHMDGQVNTNSNFASVDVSRVASSFDEKGYSIIQRLLPRDLLGIAFRYYLSYVGLPGYYTVDKDILAMDRYVDALGEAMMPGVQRQIEALYGLRLLPTYSFARIYTTESRLTKHVDRGACEVSATMTVGFSNTDELWPIYVESDGDEIPVRLDVGDALVYRGMELPHWREPLPKGVWCQLFFHFVLADGAKADLHYDGRGRLGPDVRYCS